MLNGAVTNRYTQGLYLVAEQHGLTDVVDQNLRQIADAINASAELKAYIEHPLIDGAKKAEVLRSVFRDGLEPIVHRFLRVLFARKRGAYVRAIADRFHVLAEASKGRVTVSVDSAYPLSEPQQKQLEEALGKAFGKAVQASVQVTPELIAGIRVKVGNRVLDASLQNALQQVKQKLSIRGAANVQ